ncbi:hypothetical protein DES34_10966 [Brevibacillus brevis]|nr:hypothetical protein DES34_10966 [Brevibacillus brevis]TQK42140.1 hypothetical protein FB479_115132 [Brevibacillus sp. AG162]VEF86811.1 Uncharacterised protein [Brevibacillus brevis]
MSGKDPKDMTLEELWELIDKEGIQIHSPD